MDFVIPTSVARRNPCSLARFCYWKSSGFKGCLAGETAILGRYGDDEFVLLFPGKVQEQAFLILEQIRQALAQKKLTFGSGKVLEGISISTGLASFSIDGRSIAELLRKAIRRCTAPKRKGGRKFGWRMKKK